MAKALDEQQRQLDIAAPAFEERLALLVDREATERENKRLITRLRFASLRQNAVVVDTGGRLRSESPADTVGMRNAHRSRADCRLGQFPLPTTDTKWTCWQTAAREGPPAEQALPSPNLNSSI